MQFLCRHRCSNISAVAASSRINEYCAYLDFVNCKGLRERENGTEKKLQSGEQKTLNALGGVFLAMFGVFSKFPPKISILPTF